MDNCIKYLLIIVFLFLNFLNLNSQFRDEKIDSSQAAGNGYWYFPKYNQYEIAYLTSDINPQNFDKVKYESMFDFILLDNLKGKKLYSYIYENYAKRWINEKKSNDTIKNWIKNLYFLKDYNPIIYHLYMNNYEHTEKMQIFQIVGLDHQILSQILSNNSRYEALNMLNWVDYILRVKVNSIDSINTRNYYNNKSIIDPNEYIYRVKANVIDTLKGRAFQGCKFENMNEVNNTICFTYGTGPYDNENSNFKIDPSLKNNLGDLSLKSGDELIVLLEHYHCCSDYNYNYFNLTLITVFKIKNGIVSDNTHFWSDNDNLEYDNWKVEFNKIKNKLLNGDY